jgi:hypothetical protein
MDNIGNGNEKTLKWVYIEYLNMGVSLEISLGYKDIYNIYRYIYISWGMFRNFAWEMMIL